MRSLRRRLGETRRSLKIPTVECWLNSIHIQLREREVPTGKCALQTTRNFVRLWDVARCTLTARALCYAYMSCAISRNDLDIIDIIAPRAIYARSCLIRRRPNALTTSTSP